MRGTFLAVALAAVGFLLIRAGRVGLAGDYVDPVGRVTAQDEALYAASAIHMAQSGGWLTPRFMGRFALYKPPLLLWTAGLSARILGISRLALRLPVVLLGGIVAGIVFLWAAELRSFRAGACAAILLLSDHVWCVLSGLSMTDGLLVGFCTIAMYCLFSDPWLESRSAFWAFAGSVAAGILTKSVAGALPLAALGIFWIAAPPRSRPRGYPLRSRRRGLSIRPSCTGDGSSRSTSASRFWDSAAALRPKPRRKAMPPSTFCA